MDKRNQIARRIARELKDGFYVNLGIGIPTLVANYIPPDIEVVLQSENLKTERVVMPFRSPSGGRIN